MPPEPAVPKLAALLEYLKRERGFDFSGYKQSGLARRITKRCSDVGVEDLDEYRDYLEANPDEFERLFDTILINVTGFLRDPDAWEYLRTRVIPSVYESHKTAEPIRCWSAGCASGEEAYGLAILFAEELGAEALRDKVKIYATDADEAALARARLATYSAGSIKDMPGEYRDKYFENVSGSFVVRSELRRSVIFGRNDLVQDAPISRLDLLACRNTLMYFNAEVQSRILSRFHFALKDSGYLFLGKAEMLLTYGDLFEPVDLKYRVFKKAPESSPRGGIASLAGDTDEGEVARLGRKTHLRTLAFFSSPNATVVIDADGTLALANNAARSSFGIDPRDVGRPFRDLELSYRPVELRAAIDQARDERRTVEINGVARNRPSAEQQHLDVKVIPLADQEGRVVGTAIEFVDVTRIRALEQDLRRSNQERETAYEEVQSTNEELETTNEELQSTVEELQTTNEELQSTNEEMETMNAELQSTNSELQHANDELKQRTADLNQANGFLRSILASLKAGVVVVDPDLRILLWNDSASDMWGVLSEDAVGKSILELDIGLPIERLGPSLRAFLRDDSERDELVVTGVDRHGNDSSCRVIFTILRLEDHGKQGAVIQMEKGQAGMGEPAGNARGR
jgi:two-component system CheB/CheR fusion protein